MTEIEQDNRNQSPVDPVRMVLFQAGLILAWIAVWWASRLLEYADHASLWYPPAALSYAIFRHFDWRGAPAVVIASMVVTVLADATYQEGLSTSALLTSGVLYALAHGIPYFLAARLMGTYAPTGSSRAAPRTAVAFLLICTLASLLAAVLGAYSLHLTGMLGRSEAMHLVLPWWIGDFAGLLALGPVLISVLNRLASFYQVTSADLLPPNRYLQAPNRRLRVFAGKLGSCVALIVVAALLAALFPDQEPLAFLVFFVIIPQMWIVHSEGALRGLISVATISTTIAVVTPLFDLGQNALIYQFAMIIMAASAYYGLAVPMLFADNRELSRLVTIDTLTGAATRHHFKAQSELELQRASRYGESVSLIVFDIDRFKSINDSGGHLLGDHVLTSVARACHERLRNTDLLGRLGGDEFVVLLPMTPLDQARETAERLRAAVADIQVKGGGARVEVSASFGVVEINIESESYVDAFVRADKALYDAKNAGRNQVAIV